jgi:hypothetical protein
MTFIESADTTTHRLGALETSALGLGCMGLSQGYGPADDGESLSAIHAALDSGITMLDTAMSYGQGHNEEIVGRAVSTSGIARDSLQIATKLGIVRREGGVQLDAHPSRIATYCDASLRRLGMETIDLYYLHRVDPQVPIEESIAAMADLVTQGKVRHLGVSEVTPEELRRAHAVHPIAAVQMEWSLMWREPELSIVPAARDLGVGLVPYSPLGRGLLSGRIDAGTVADSPFRANDPRFNGDHLSANLSHVAALTHLARSWDMTTAQVALAWLLSQGDDVVPIPGTRRADRVRENASAMSCRLTAEELEMLNSAVPAGAWEGDRRSFAVPVTARSTPHRDERQARDTDAR